MRWFWFLCLSIAAVSDIKERRISCKILIVCGSAGMAYAAATEMLSHIQGLAVGIGILFISRVTRGAIGAGDGWFFVASAWYLSAGEVWMLLLGSLFVSWCLSVGIILHRVWMGRNTVNATLPFLACMWPAGVWILLQKEGLVWLSTVGLG